MTSLKATLQARIVTTLLALWLAPLWSNGQLLGGPPSAASPDAFITETCLDQDKLPCAMETRYLPDPDGSNGTKIVVAYPFTVRRTNSQYQFYFPSLAFEVPPDHGMK